MQERHARVTSAELIRLGQLSKNEIRVFLFLKLSRNERTGRCDPSRAAIVAGSGVLKSHVSEAIAGLSRKGWAVEDDAGNFVISGASKVPDSGTATDDEKVPDSGTAGKVEKFPIQEQPQNGQFPIQEPKVPDSGQKVPEIGTRRKYSLNNKNNKGTDMSGKPDGGSSDDVKKVFEYYKKVHEKTARFTLTKKRRGKIRDRLKTKSVADLFDAINGCKVSPHHQGKNPDGTFFDDIELICRTDDHTERFIEIFERRQAFSGRRGGETFAAGPDRMPNAAIDVIDDEPLIIPAAELKPSPDLPAAVVAVWNRARTALADKLGADVVRHWFDAIRFDGIDKAGRRFLLRAGRTAYDWITLYYAEALEACLMAGGLDGYKIAWEIEGECETSQLRAAI